MTQIQTTDCGVGQTIRQLEGQQVFVYNSGNVTSIGGSHKFFSDLGDAILMALEDYEWAKAQCKRASNLQDMVTRGLVKLQNALAVYESESGRRIR